MPDIITLGYTSAYHVVGLFVAYTQWCSLVMLYKVEKQL